ncbi:MAG: 7-cyano-7-deazaguanine synthase QueC [Promethearchaeia archaeon]
MQYFDEPAIVVFSGGQDSTTCLVWALKRFKKLYIMTFNYHQRHSIEIEMAKKIVNILKSENRKKHLNWLKDDKIEDHKIVEINVLSDLLKTAMIQESEIIYDEETRLPTTFVPGRNILFLTIAAAYAYQKKIRHIVIGVSQTDYSGYPDCRDSTIKALQATIKLGMDYDVIIHTPLMWRSKAETIKLMQKLGGLELYKYTHTCYRGERPACGECFACELRLKGFEEVGIKDPLEYKNQK